MARTLHRLGTFVGLSLVAIYATGCVSAEKYNAQKMRADQYAEQLANAQSQVNSATAQNEVFKQQLERIRNSGDNQSALLVNQASTIADLTRQNEDLNARYAAAMRSIGQAGGGQLPVALTNELTNFAAQNPDLVDFDEHRGLVKFKSDVTFTPGSAEVKPEAKSAIDRFAQILNSPAAAPYDLMVVGHTDNKPVSNPATIRAGHLDNWYLSVHRAIAVSKVLRSDGVNAARVEVAGFGDQRPIETSTSPDSMAKNRRVEVLILPTTGHQNAVAGSAAPSPAPRSAPKAGLNKDSTSVETDRRPVINK
jgi:chemotaxis protein MotB